MVGRYRIVDEARVPAAEVVREMEGRCCFWARSPGCWCRLPSEGVDGPLSAEWGPFDFENVWL